MTVEGRKVDYCFVMFVRHRWDRVLLILSQQKFVVSSFDIIDVAILSRGCQPWRPMYFIFRKESK